MRTATVGKVAVSVKIESLEDLYKVNQGLLPADQVRSVDVPDATVDTGAFMLSLPTRFVQQLGLRLINTRKARTAAGIVDVRTFSTVHLTMQGRECNCDVVELPDVCPALIGQIPLELMDFVVDPKNQRVIGNPEHDGEEVIELY